MAEKNPNKEDEIRGLMRMLEDCLASSDRLGSSMTSIKVVEAIDALRLWQGRIALCKDKNM